MKFTSAITFLSLSACISPTFGKKMKGKGKADEIPSSLCDSDIQCGEAYTGEVKLTEDLHCPDLTIGKCAITLKGKQAVLDCNKYMIHGDSSVGNDYGICIRNGASAINCHVQKFGVGIDVENDGEVKDCDVMFNDKFGIRIENEASSTTTTKMKISNTYVHDNGDSGIYFHGREDSPETLETSIDVNNVKSNHNGGYGMDFKGPYVKLEVKVTDSETSSNGLGGIFSDAPVDLELDGIISRYNLFDGLLLEGNVMKVKVKGDVNLYKNGQSGVHLFRADVDVVVEKRGALNSCGHNGTYCCEDINSDGGDVTFSANGYTCTTVRSPGVNPPGVNPPDVDVNPPDVDINPFDAPKEKPPEKNPPDDITCNTCPTSTCPQPQPQ